MTAELHDAELVEPPRRRKALLWLVGTSGRLYAKARDYHVSAKLPGLTGAALISAAAAMRFGIWAGLAVAGAFCLRIDSRMR